MKYFIQVFGCQMNLSDSERACSLLEDLGYIRTETEKDADLIMVLACAVRQTAVDRIYGRAKRWRAWKKERPLITIVTGCLLQHDRPKMAKYFDYVFPIKDLSKLPDLLKSKPENPVISTDAPLDEYFSVTPKHSSSFQAFVPISSGCNKFCSYCAVPFTRGREISRLPDEIIREVGELVQRGYKEITLLGQNVNSYGWDFEGVSLNLPNRKVLIYKPGAKGELELQRRQVDHPMNFPQLLTAIAGIPGDFWIRFITSHPYDMNDELIETVAAHDKLTPYIHLAVQSGSNKILRKMNRLYTIEHYRERAAKIREMIPDATITTDIIVGFCGENDKDFEETNQLVKDIRYDMAYIAQYSVRSGTIAEDFADDVSRETKAQRHKDLNLTLRDVALSNNQKLVGTTQRVLVERYREGHGYGKTKAFKNMKIAMPENLTGHFVTARVTRVGPWSLSGELVTE